MEEKEKISEPVLTIDKKEDEDADTKELDEAIDMSLAVLPLESTEQKLMVKIIEAPTREELQQQLELFNINQSKKNAIRVVKLNSLLDKVEDQAIERFEKRPDQVSNKELLDYMTVVSNQIDRAQKGIDSVKDAPAINVISKNTEVNINVGPQLDRDTKEKVMDVISALIKQVNKNTEVIDADFVRPEQESEDDDVIDKIYNEDKLNIEEN